MGEVKKDEYKEMMETESTHTTNELAASGLEALSSRRNNNTKGGDSSVSNFTFSDSELVFSDSDVSKDLLEDAACRESIKLLQENIEDKQAGIKISKENIGEREGKLKDAQEIIKDLQGRIQQKGLELSKINIREEGFRNQIVDLDGELNDLYSFSDFEAEVRKIHEMKQKFMGLSRATETIKKRIASSRATDLQNHAVLIEKEKDLAEIKEELESLKNQHRMDDDQVQVKLLEINKEVLLSHLNSNVRLTQEILDKIQKQLELNINQLVEEADRPLQEQIFILLAETKEKSSKIEEKIEVSQQKFYEKRNQIMQNFRASKDKIFSLSRFDENMKKQWVIEEVKREKESLRLELQSQRLNELKFSVSQSELEKVYLHYQVIFT